MKVREATFATTNVDSHGEMLTEAALEQMAKHIASAFLPFGIEHDPRIPPIGRIAQASVVANGAGFALQGTIEVFEDGDQPPVPEPSRPTLLRWSKDDQPSIIDDRSFRGSEDQEVMGLLRQTLGASAHTERKKAAEAIAIITLAVKGLGTILGTGFVAKIGEDAWDAAKPHLKRLFRIKRPAPAQLFVIEHTVELGGRNRRVDVILSDPSDEDIEALTQRRLKPIEGATLRALEGFPEIVRLVFSFSDAAGPVLQYGVLSSGFPIHFAAPRPPFPDHTGISFGG